MTRSLLVPLTVLLIAGCSGSAPREHTLADLDRFERQAAPEARFLEATESQVSHAYAAYLRDTDGTDTVRLMALHRLAEIQLEDGLTTLHSSEQDDMPAEALARLQRSVQLMETALRDFPERDTHDALLYRLAFTYDTLGRRADSIAALERLADRHPESAHIVEARFRLGEHYFAHGRYTQAQASYDVVVDHPDNLAYRVRSRFKRGWARYKQELYWEALEDLYYVLDYFDETSRQAPLDAADEKLRADCERALALSFSYLGGAVAISDYFAYEPAHPGAALGHRVLGDLYARQGHPQIAEQTYLSFARAHPDSPEVASLELRNIENWEAAGDVARAVGLRRQFDRRFGVRGRAGDEIPAAQAAASERNVAALARHFHTAYQREARSADLDEAIHWYRHLVAAYADSSARGEHEFLFADLLTDAGDHDAALVHYDKAWSLLGGAQRREAALARVTAARARLDTNTAALAIRDYRDRVEDFIAAHPDDAAGHSALLAAAQWLYDREQYPAAADMAGRMPDAAGERERRDAFALGAFTALQREDYARAELRFAQTLATPAEKARHSNETLHDGLAAAIYGQGAAARDAGDAAAAIRHFLRVRDLAPGADAAMTAEYDAATLLLADARWEEAIALLTRLRDQNPRHALDGEISRKLALAYEQTDRAVDSARELAGLARQRADTELGHQALWKAAQLYRQHGETRAAIETYRQYVDAGSAPFETRVQALHHLAGLLDAAGQEADATGARETLIELEASGATARSAQTRQLAGDAAIVLADRQFAVYRALPLNLPLDASLRRKKAALERTVTAYGRAADYGFTRHITRATHRLGEVYSELASALLESKRPPNLSPDALAEYDILLEDQAFVFEDKAVDFFEANVARIETGVYDASVAASLERLRTLFPARYDRMEKVETHVSTLD